MAGDTDFLAMFQELGLSSGCSLDEFKLAFRRRVAQLHPDRTGGGTAGAEARLQRLTAMYGAALDFHRQHGRLPGYVMRVQASAAATHRPTGSSNTPPPPPTGQRRSVYVLVIAVATALLAWWLLDGTQDDAQPAEGSSARMAAEPSHVKQTSLVSVNAPPRLLLGMDRRDALTIQGEPVSESEDHWEYGPSWIAFKCGKVSDWYSSPLRPLHTYSPHPTSADVSPIPALHDGECVPLADP